jgi:hypothetical protein
MILDRNSNRRIFMKSVSTGILTGALPGHARGHAGTPGKRLTLANAKLRVAIDEASGSVAGIVNVLTGDAYDVVCEPFHLRTTLGEFAACDCRLTGIRRTAAGVTAEYEYGSFRVALNYTLAPGAHFMEKQVEVSRTDRLPFGIFQLGIERIRFTPALCQVIKDYCTGGRGYSGFYDMCPTAMFLRAAKSGIFLGVENPVFQMETDGMEHRLWYKVGLKVEAGQTYTSEPEFLGVYRLRGKKYSYEEYKRGVNWVRTTHVLPPNPDHSMLDWGEIEAMQQCVESRSPAYTPGCLQALNNWAGANYTEHWDEYRQVMQSAQRLGIRSLIFASTFGLSEPAASPAASSLSLDQHRNPRPDPHIGRTLEYARQLGLKLGGYFSPEDRGGGRWSSDHISNARRDWIVERSDSVIRKYDLGWWGNDYMEFNQRDNATDHGHITPEGAVYLQWRNLVDVYRRTRASHPDVNVGLFGGLTSCGPWSLEYADYANLPGVDSHDSTLCPFPDIHYNHLFGNEERMRSWYGHNLLYYPPYKCRYSVGHLGQDGLHVWGDPFGWKMNFLGALGTSTILEYAYIPVGAELKDEDVRFARKWIDWADRNIKYLRVRKDLFGEPAIGRVDGYAHIVGDRGFIFLFNPNHRTIAAKIPLNEWIGLTEGKSFLVKELYPREGRVHFVDHDKGCAVYGRDLTLNVPPQGVQILEIVPHQDGPALFGAAGNLRSGPAGEIELAGLAGEEGEEVTVGVRSPAPVTTLRLDGKAIPHRRAENGILVARLRFEGERIQRELKRWTADGDAIPIPNIREYSRVRLKCGFHLPANVSRILAAQKPDRKVAAEDTVRALDYQKSSQRLANADPYERIPTLDPSRLLVTIPTTYPETIEGLRAWLNGAEVAVKRFESSTGGAARRLFCHYLDITSEAKFAAANELVLEFQGLRKGQFLGGYLENLPVQLATSVTPLPPGDSSLLEEPAGQPIDAFPG